MAKSLNYCLSVLALLLLVGCAQEAPLYKKEIEPARHKKLAQKLTDAIHYHYQGSVPQQLLLLEALSYDSINGDIWREKGVPFLKRGMATEFEEHYKNAVGYNPMVWAGWRGYIYLFFYRDYQRAIAGFDMTDTLTPGLVDYPQALSVDYLRGICYLKLNQHDTAVSLFDKHIAYEKEISGPQYVMPQAYLYKGIAAYKSEKYALAQQTFKEGVELAPQNADLLFWHAKALLIMGEKARARISLEEAALQLKAGNRNIRPYVEEFFQTYPSSIAALKAQMQ
jgi:tetratricopeptide (TPR) repeat protein